MRRLHEGRPQDETGDIVPLGVVVTVVEGVCHAHEENVDWRSEENPNPDFPSEGANDWPGIALDFHRYDRGPVVDHHRVGKVAGLLAFVNNAKRTCNKIG